MDDKKKMSPLTAYEKEVLLELTQQYKNVIENKKTDAVGIKEKNKAWEELCQKFCAAGKTTKRSASQLKKSWENLKYKARKDNCEIVKQRLLTGGGPPRKEKDEFEFSAKMDSMFPHLNLRIESPFDSDGFQQTAAASAEEEEAGECPYLDCVSEEAPVESSPLTKPVPSSSQEDCSVAIVETPPSRKRECEKYNSVTKKRALRMVTTEYMDQRNALELHQMKELHNEKMTFCRQLMANEAELHAQRMKQEAELHAQRVKQEAEVHAAKFKVEQLKALEMELRIRKAL
ncbi:myb/SANT-like DNA-binding domain-containing protein 3 [Periplaneta americana]|uniref:myb/SANT-like DNA-binding domain-containing protein 3 n=1 Tax=Periplaneta americana TaxID=6978 RepID=UPI0037E9B222